MSTCSSWLEKAVYTSLTFEEAVLDLDTTGGLQFQLGGVRRLLRGSQALELTVTDLFYLKGMDIGSVNVPYLLARYLRLFASGRKQVAMISRGQFICKEINDTWAWVAPRPERQQVAAASDPETAKDAPVVDEGAQADPTPVQAPQPPPPARTMPQRMARLEEDVHEIRVALGEQREVMDAMAKDFSRFTVWAARGISQLLDSAGATCV
ncbi:hypothetical protein Tco_1335970 [Tanacetum coccineum]